MLTRLKIKFKDNFENELTLTEKEKLGRDKKD